MENKMKLSEGLKKYTMVIVLAVVIILFTANTGGKMLLPQNVNNLVAQNAYVFILATGMLFCILTGGNIDLSVGSVVCFVGALGGTMMITMGINPYLSMLAMLIIGMLVGAWQGFWIAYVRIPPFIVTLAGMLMFRGLSNVVLQGMTLSPIPDQFLNLFNTYVPDLFGMEGFNLTCFLAGIIACLVFVVLELINRRKKLQKGYRVDPIGGMAIKMVLISSVVLFFMYKLARYKGIPNALIWVAVIIGIYSYISSKTTTGRYFYAVGGNEKATRLSGIDTNKVYFLAYLNMGLLAAVAGMVTVARLNSANPTAGNSYEMDAIGACFIGGASAYGGTGTVPGVIVGATLMGVLNLGMSIMGVDQNLQKVVKGAVLMAAVIFDVVSKRKSFIVKQ
ncbi:MAG: sugar ABC transporter permease [Hungatella sp.]|jgi:putative multiple sugar transport system permease protein|nr:sugar ABC transporter permease [Hungatella sp.]